MTRAEAIAHLLTQPEDAAVFMVCVTPDRIADRLQRDYPDVAAKWSRCSVLYRAETAIQNFSAPNFDDEVGVANDIVSDLVILLTY